MMYFVYNYSIFGFSAFNEFNNRSRLNKNNEINHCVFGAVLYAIKDLYFSCVHVSVMH